MTFTRGLPYFQLSYKSQEKTNPVIGTFIFVDAELMNGVKMYIFEYCAFYHNSDEVNLVEFTKDQCSTFLSQAELVKELSLEG
jgi:hypothetical protein